MTKKRVLVTGSEFATLHRGKKFQGKPGDGQYFTPSDFTEKRLQSLLGSGALKWVTVEETTVPKPSKEQ